MEKRPVRKTGVLLTGCAWRDSLRLGLVSEFGSDRSAWCSFLENSMVRAQGCLAPGGRDGDLRASRQDGEKKIMIVFLGGFYKYMIFISGFLNWCAYWLGRAWSETIAAAASLKNGMVGTL